MKIGIVGASGLVGYNLFQFLSEKKENVLGTYCSTKKDGLVKLDLLTDDFSLFDKCTHVIIIAALANIDQCYLKKEEAYKINVERTVELIQRLGGKGIKSIFISSDQVFDGIKGYYKEDDLPNPVNYYGKFKLQVEEFLKNNLKNYLILRLSKIYSRNLQDNSMFAEILLKLQKKEKIKAAFNQIYNPTEVRKVCAGIHLSIKKDLDSVYHLADKQIMSRYDFARSIAEEFGLDEDLIEKVDFNRLPVLEKRALNSSLNIDKFAKISDLS